MSRSLFHLTIFSYEADLFKFTKTAYSYLGKKTKTQNQKQTNKKPQKTQRTNKKTQNKQQQQQQQKKQKKRNYTYEKYWNKMKVLFVFKENQKIKRLLWKLSLQLARLT